MVRMFFKNTLNIVKVGVYTQAPSKYEFQLELKNDLGKVLITGNGHSLVKFNNAI